MSHNILKLDISGIPEGWITPRDGAELIARDLMSWSLGNVVEIFHGGIDHHGRRTIIEVPSIVAVNGTADIYLPAVPVGVTKDKLLKRDRNMCAYCGEVFDPEVLEAEHIHPESRGGEWSWMNLVAACHSCNQLKKDMTPGEAGMPLRFLPYVPSRWEAMILGKRHILADQMEFLLASVPRHSRLLLPG